MNRSEVAALTVVLLVDCVWVLQLVLALLVDCLALVSCVDVLAFFISKFNFGRATDCTDASPSLLVNRRKTVLHHDLEGRVILLSFHNLHRFRLRSTKLAQSHQRPP
jgi:hypothetical protein